MHRGLIKLLSISLIVVLVDQISKIIVSSALVLNESIELISGFLNLVYIKNPGVAFGIFRNMPSSVRMPLLTAFSLIAIFLVFYIYIKNSKQNKAEALSLSLIIGGAIGNLIDRIFYGEVIDFIDVHIGAAHWPAFNISDTVITIGVAVLLLNLFFPALFQRKM